MSLSFPTRHSSDLPSTRAAWQGDRQARIAVAPRMDYAASTPRETGARGPPDGGPMRSEEHTSELQSLMRISYAVFCLKNKKKHTNKQQNTQTYEQPSVSTHNYNNSQRTNKN